MAFAGGLKGALAEIAGFQLMRGFLVASSRSAGRIDTEDLDRAILDKVIGVSLRKPRLIVVKQQNWGFEFIMRARRPNIVYLLIPTLCGMGLLSGCQIGSSVPKAKLAEYRGKVDAAGLASPMADEAMKITAALPSGWLPMAVQKSALYIHQQWRSPSRRTAVGVTYIRMPIPLSTKMLAWIARGEATKRLTNARILRQWTDSIGREWFEAEDAKYHMVGYAMTSGFDAWINYSGYRVREPQEPGQIELAVKSLGTILPLTISVPDGGESDSAR